MIPAYILSSPVLVALLVLLIYVVKRGPLIFATLAALLFRSKERRAEAARLVKILDAETKRPGRMLSWDKRKDTG